MPARRLINDLFIQFICSRSVEILLKSWLPTFVVLACMFPLFFSSFYIMENQSKRMCLCFTKTNSQNHLVISMPWEEVVLKAVFILFFLV